VSIFLLLIADHLLNLAVAFCFKQLLNKRSTCLGISWQSIRLRRTPAGFEVSVPELRTSATNRAWAPTAPSASNCPLTLRATT